VVPDTTASSTVVSFGDEILLREIDDVNGRYLNADFYPGSISIIRGYEGDVMPLGATLTRDTVDGTLVGNPNRLGSGQLGVLVALPAEARFEAGARPLITVRVKATTAPNAQGVITVPLTESASARFYRMVGQ
jgi:hypothetical protein